MKGKRDKGLSPFSEPPSVQFSNERARLLDDLRIEAQRVRNRITEIEEELESEPTIRNIPCLECERPEEAHIYNLDKIHHLDGNRSNRKHSNKAIVCPCCEAHILLSAHNPWDVWELKKKGVTNAAIARKLGTSRQQVGKLLKAYKRPPRIAEEVDIDKLIKEIQAMEREAIRTGHHWAGDYDTRPPTPKWRSPLAEDTESTFVRLPDVSKKRVTDRRTLKKKLLKQMKKQGIKPKGGKK
jgi:hypothetical protein